MIGYRRNSVRSKDDGAFMGRKLKTKLSLEPLLSYGCDYAFSRIVRFSSETASCTKTKHSVTF